jgi:hypothetical protein
MVTHDVDEAVHMADRILIMAGAPGAIVDSVSIELDGERERDDPSVLAVRRRLMERFEAAEATMRSSAASVGQGNSGAGLGTQFSLDDPSLAESLNSAQL